MHGESFASFVVPAEVWEQPRMRQALTSRDIAAVLGLLQEAIPRLSQRRLATAIGTEQGRVNEWINRRRQVATLAMYEQIANGLEMPDPARVALGLAPRGIAATVSVLGASPPPETPSASPRYPSTQEIEEVTAMAAAESARFGRFAQQTNTGPHTLEQFYSDLRRIVIAYPHSPVYPLFMQVRELRDEVFKLLEGRQPPGQTRELYLIAAALCGVLANASFDLGNFAAAETQARTALVAAEQAGHTGMRTWVRGTQALIAYWDHRDQDAVDLAADGWRHAPIDSSARVRIACIEARARGRMHDSEGTDDALRRAEQAREHVNDTDGLVGMMAFPTAKQLYYAGAARLWLGDDNTHLAAAERLSADAVDLYAADPPAERRIGEMSLARMDLAVARLARNDLDGAANQIEQVLDVSGTRRTEAVSRRLLDVYTALQAPHWGTTELATRLRDRILDSPVRTTPELPLGGDS